MNLGERVQILLEILDSTNIYIRPTVTVSLSTFLHVSGLDSTKIDSRSEDIGPKNRQAKKVSLSLTGLY